MKIVVTVQIDRRLSAPEPLQMEKYMLDKDLREPLFDFLEEFYGKIRIFEEKVTGISRTDALGVILVVAVVLAKLFADGVDLLTQVIIALVFVDIFLYFFGNFTLELQNVQLLRQQLNCQLQSLNRV